MLGDISAIATLVLFVIYFIGRIITILMERKICSDEVEVSSIEDVKKFTIIEEIDTSEIEENHEDDYSTIIVLTSKQGIRKIDLIRIAYDDDMNEIKKNNSVVFSCGFVNIGQSFAVRTFLPEILPQYRIVYTTYDYKTVTLNLCDNLKNSVISEMLQPKHTLKSVLYYTFR